MLTLRYQASKIREHCLREKDAKAASNHQHEADAWGALAEHFVGDEPVEITLRDAAALGLDGIDKILARPRT